MRGRILGGSQHVSEPRKCELTMAQKLTKKTTRGARKSKRKAVTLKAVLRKAKRKANTARPVVPKPKREIDSASPVVIKSRRKVETSDALIFPSGRPIRKR